MAAPEFEWKSLYAELKRALLDLAAEVQQKLRDKVETQDLGLEIIDVPNPHWLMNRGV